MNTPQQEAPRRERLAVQDVGDVSVITFVDKKILDSVNIQTIHDDLRWMVEDLGRRKMLLNFDMVDFMSSCVIGTLIDVNKRMTQVGGKLHICCIADKILPAFRITGADRLLRIFKDQETALRSF